jgi:hypothetical protein
MVVIGLYSFIGFGCCRPPLEMDPARLAEGFWVTVEVTDVPDGGSLI